MDRVLLEYALDLSSKDDVGDDDDSSIASVDLPRNTPIPFEEPKYYEHRK